MTIDKTVASAVGKDIVKLLTVYALADVALKTGQTFNQFAEAVAAAGVPLPSVGGRDCTDLHQDAEKLGIVMCGALNKHAVAVRVMELFGQFIRENDPEWMPQFVRVLERFTPYLAEELS